MNVNKVFIVGRMTADPQLRTTPSGQPVTSFSVATNRVWTNKAGSKQEETEFHNVVAWGRTAEIASQFLKKGSLVFVEGRLRTRTWQDKQGQNRRTTEIMCERLQLGPRPAGAGGAAPTVPKEKEEQAPTAEAEIPTIDIEEDIKPEDLPF
jgi:single-strand DNA-binding protein